MLGPLGEVPLAAASLVQSVIVIFYAGLYGVAGAVGVLIGQSHGAGDPVRVHSMLRHGLAFGLASGVAGAAAMWALLYAMPWTGQPTQVLDALPHYWIAMSLLLIPYTLSMVGKQYLESTERPWTAAWLTLLPLAFNVPLNWLLIYGNAGFPKLGLLGAGLASLLAFVAGLIVMFVYIWRFPDRKGARDALRLRRSEFGALTREGAPMSLQYIAEASSVAIAGILIGLLGATALAANQIVFSVGALVYMAPLGMSGAVSIRIAQAIGANESHRVRAIGLAGILLVSLWMLAFTALMIGWGEQIAAAFVNDRPIIAAATAMFIAVGLMQVFDGLQSVGLGALRGMLDNRWPTRVSLFAYWLVALPLSVLFGFVLGFGAPGIWLGFGLGIAVAGVLLVWRFLAQTRTIVP